MKKHEDRMSQDVEIESLNQNETPKLMVSRWKIEQAELSQDAADSYRL